MSRKWLIAALAIIILITALVTLVAVNFNGWGTSLAGAGGPIAAGLYSFANNIPIWISSGGWPTLAIGIIVFVFAWPLICCIIFWQKDIPYVLHLQQNPNAVSTGNYQSAPNQNIIPLSDLQNSPSQKKE